MKFVCTVCGYVYEGDAAPAECPICHAGADKFKKVEDGAMTLAAEHEFGVYASTVIFSLVICLATSLPFSYVTVATTE